jgi:hypothetical protein
MLINIKKGLMTSSLDITKALCLADTLHDFNKKKALGDNAIFKDFKSSMNIDNIINTAFNATSASIERKVLEFFTQKYVGSPINIPMTPENFQTDFIKEQNNGNKPFFLIAKDIFDDKFRTVLSAVCAIQQNVDIGTIKFVTDGTIIGNQDVICKLRYGDAKGIMMESPAYIYDRGNESKEDDCSAFEKDAIIATVSLEKANGNLFGFEKITCSIDGQKDPFLQTDINTGGTRGARGTRGAVGAIGAVGSHVIKLSDFCYYNNAQNTAKFASLFIDAIKAKRAKNMFKKIKDMYGININLSTLSIDRNNILNQIFDCKRAGDQMQVEYAKNNNCIFISNDIISIAYAIKLGIPCIKTSQMGKKVNKIRRPTLLTFYNFDKDLIAKKMFGIDYYHKTLKNYKSNLEKLKTFYETFERERALVEANIAKKIEISWTVLKYYPVIATGNRPERGSYRRSNASTLQFADLSVKLYQYQYLHFLNLVTCILIRTIINYYRSLIISNKLNEVDKLLNDAIIIVSKNDDKFDFTILKDAIKNMELNPDFILLNKLISYLNVNDSNNISYLQKYIEFIKQKSYDNYNYSSINDFHGINNDLFKNFEEIAHYLPSITIPLISLGIKLINISYNQYNIDFNIVATTHIIFPNVYVSGISLNSYLGNTTIHNKYISEFKNNKVFIEKLFSQQGITLNDIILADNYNMKMISKDLAYIDNRIDNEILSDDEGDEEDDGDDVMVDVSNFTNVTNFTNVSDILNRPAKVGDKRKNDNRGGKPKGKRGGNPDTYNVLSYNDAFELIRTNKKILNNLLKIYNYDYSDYISDLYEVLAISIIKLLPIFDKKGKFLYLSDDRLYDSEFVNYYDSNFWNSFEIKEEYFKLDVDMPSIKYSRTVSYIPVAPDISKFTSGITAGGGKPKKEAVSKPKKETVAKPKKETVSKPEKETVAKPKKETVAKPKKEAVAKPKKEQNNRCTIS